MEIIIKMNICGFTNLTLLDFPEKVACTVFTAGCNLRCPFCHNFQLTDPLAAEEGAETAFFEFLKKRRGILDGVCISGGEPLLNGDITDFIKKIKDLGYAIKLDTNGTLPERLDAVLKSGLCSYVAMDIKSSPNGYAKASGTENADISKIKESINLIENSGIEHEFRSTIVKGIHTQSDIAEMAAMLDKDERYFLQTFKMSDNVPNRELRDFSKDEAAELLKIAQRYVPGARLRGTD